MIILNEDRSTNPRKQYKADKKALNSEIEIHTVCLNRAIEELNRAQETYGFSSKEYNEAFIQTERWRYHIEEENLALKFIRPNSQSDIEYRINQYNEFTEKLQSVISKNLDLRFHGTPIYFAEQIIKTKTITSTADRYNGFIKSTDRNGEFSASSVQTLGDTIKLFSDIQAYYRSLPCGCIFALFPKGPEDNEFPNLMKTIDLSQNPEQLYGVFTTPENIDRVSTWMQEAGLDASKVYTFESFLEQVQETSRLIDGKEVQAVDPIYREENNFGVEEMKKLSYGRQTGRLAQLQFKLKNIFSRNIEKEGKRNNGTSRD